MELRKKSADEAGADNFQGRAIRGINHSDINDAQIKRIIGVIDPRGAGNAELDFGGFAHL